MQDLLGKDKVFDLANDGPEPTLTKFQDKNFRILVCGGDGSVGWILLTLDNLNYA